MCFTAVQGSKLLLNHVIIEVSEWLILVLKSKLVASVINMLVSSVKRTILLYIGIILGKSFIYRRKSRGPRIEPWGTPCLISSQFE